MSNLKTPGKEFGHPTTDAHISSDPDDQTPHENLSFLFTAGCVVLALGIVTANVAVVFLALTVVGVCGYSYLSKPKAGATFQLKLGSDSGQKEKNTTYSTLVIEPPAEGCNVILRVTYPGTSPMLVHVEAKQSRSIEFGIVSFRTGPREQFSVLAMPLNTSYDWFGVWSELKLPETLVLAPLVQLSRLPASPVARGLTGPRVARKPGDGMEFRDLGPMRWGDSQRRIDWKASARTTSTNGELLVRRTLAQAEATTIIMLDSRDDVGPEAISWGSHEEIRSDQRTSLDLAREAATTIAQTAISRGDRVGYEDLSRPRRPILPSTGQRHLDRIRHGVALTAPIGAVRDRVRPPVVPAESFVFVLSTFLDDSGKNTVLALVNSGHHVLAIDVLPEISHWSMSERQKTALDLVLAERNARLRTLRTAGVSTLAWNKPEERVHVLAYSAQKAGRRR